MTQTAFSAAVKAAVEQWMQSATLEEQLAQMAHPATLSAVLSLAVQQSLLSGGTSPAAVRGEVLNAPYYHLRGVFDASALVDTPQDFTPVPDTASTIAGRAAALAIHGALQMETVSYGTENTGSLFVNLVCIPGSGAFAEKSRSGLRGHTDGVTFPFNGDDDPEDRRIAPSPDLVTLVGLRNPKSVPTKVIPLESALACLGPGDIDELAKPQYSITPQKTFVHGMQRILGRRHVVINAPVLKVAESTYVRYSHSSVVPTESGGTAETAANNLEDACNTTAVPIVVQPGDVLIISNRRSLHGRGEVGSDVGGESRWLLRAYALDTSTLPAYKRHMGDAPPHMLFP